jgi:hypothetical protein
MGSALRYASHVDDGSQTGPANHAGEFDFTGRSMPERRNSQHQRTIKSARFEGSPDGLMLDLMGFAPLGHLHARCIRAARRAG